MLTTKITRVMCALAVCASTMLLGSCSDSDGPGGPDNSATMKLRRLDLSGATALSLIESGARAAEGVNTLFKVDSDGNLTAVQLYVEQGDDGTTTTTRTDISVHPRRIFALSKAYTYMTDCRFFAADGREVHLSYNDPGAFYFNILVQNATGRIFYVPAAAQEYFPAYEGQNFDAAPDKHGNLFITTANGQLMKVTCNDDVARLESFGPQELSWQGTIYPLDNGTVAIKDYYNSLGFVYPNGGYERLSGSSDDPRESNSHGEVQKDRLSFTVHDGRILAIKLPKENFQHDWIEDGWNSGDYYLNSEVSVQLVEVKAGTTYGGVTVSAPFAELTGTNNELKYGPSSYDAPDWTYFTRHTDNWYSMTNLYVGERYYILGSVLAYEKASGQWVDLAAAGLTDKVILPDAGNVYHDRAWNVWYNGAQWFDVETLEYGTVNYPTFDSYTELSTVIDVPHGKMMRTMLSPYDGKKQLITIDIETGEYQSTEFEPTSNVINLIPLN